MNVGEINLLDCNNGFLFSFLTVVAFLAEFFDDGAYFIDSTGHFRKLIYLQHMSIYGAFIVHGLADMAEYYGVPSIKGTNYMSGCLAFLWYV